MVFTFFILEIIGLYFLSRKLSFALSLFLPIPIFALVLLPGVIVHEFSHLILATLLFVPVGEINFTPQKTIDGIRLGSVGIARVDIFRRLFIGGAPIFGGLLLCYLAYFYLIASGSFLPVLLAPYELYMRMLIGYVLFTIGNTMFSSKKDMEGALECLVLFSLVVFILYVFGIRISPSMLQFLTAGGIQDILFKLNLVLLIPLVGDMVVIGLAGMFRVKSLK